MTSKPGSWIVFLLLGGVAAYAIAEEITLTTYYPSPRGVYGELRVGSSGPYPAPIGALHVLKDTDDANTVAFRVDDQANDPSPFVIDVNGNVGIGTAAPVHPFEVIRTGPNASSYVAFKNDPVFILLGAASQAVGGGHSWIVYPGNKEMHFSTCPAYNADPATCSDRLRFTSAGQVYVGAGNPASSAQLQVDWPAWTPRGLLPPRMTTAERNAIAGPVDGLTIYNTQDHAAQSYNGATGQWSGGAAASFWAVTPGNPNNIYNTNGQPPGTGNVGIGTNNPAGKLQVSGGSILVDNDFGLGDTSQTYGVLPRTSGNQLVLATAGAGRLFIDASGVISIPGGNDHLHVYHPSDNRFGLQTSLDGQPLGSGFGGGENVIALQPAAGNVVIGPMSTPTAGSPQNGQFGNLEVNDVHIRSTDRWVSQSSGYAFGGLYQQNFAGGGCITGNPFTGGCSCPPGGYIGAQAGSAPGTNVVTVQCVKP